MGKKEKDFTKENLIRKDLRYMKHGSLKNRLRWLKAALINAKNRALYGYAGEDWYNWDYAFAARNAKLFKLFKDKGVGILWKDIERTEQMTKEEQNEFFDKLIFWCHCLEDDGEHIAEELLGCPDGKFCSWATDKSNLEELECVRQVIKHKLFSTLEQYFDELWD